jgi:hypothetical protein
MQTSRAVSNQLVANPGTEPNQNYYMVIGSKSERDGAL